MGTYILLVNSTDHGAKGIKEIPDRQEASREMRAFDEPEHFEFIKSLP
jgi:uncharacterized protein with GYD domain